LKTVAQPYGGGRIGIQAPAKKIYSPNFIEAIKKVKECPETGATFAHFKEPWVFFETADEYTALFEKCGFNLVLSKIDGVKTRYTPEEVFSIFSSGVAVGYLSQDFYDVELETGYVDAFRRVVTDVFEQQADDTGKILLIFNRIFLVAVKRD